MLKNKVILIVSPEAWEKVKVSKHHYAINLSFSNKVFFLNPPSKSLNVISSPYDNLKIVNYRGLTKGFRFYPYCLQKIIFRKIYNEIEKKINKEIDIVWSFENSAFYDFSLIPKEVYSISHIVDLNMNFHFKRATETADLVLTCNSHILKKQLKINHNSHFINHGYDDTILPKKINFKRFEGLKIGYAGNLSIPYLDKSLIKQLAKEFTDINFYFAGSGKLEFSNLFRNIHLLGSLDKQELYYFYSKMDVLILTYLSDKFENQLSNPHKMMEYLATGRPIVATYTYEFRNYCDIVSMENKNQNFLEAFNNVIKNLRCWDSEENRRKRISFAENNTYKNQILRIEKLIEKNIKFRS